MCLPSFACTNSPCWRRAILRGKLVVSPTPIAMRWFRSWLEPFAARKGPVLERLEGLLRIGALSRGRMCTRRRLHAQVASGCCRLGYSHRWTMTMAPPVDAPAYHSAIYLVQLPHEGWGISDKLAGLLNDEREHYKWNATTAAVSQRNIIELETEIARRIEHLDAGEAGWIVREVSRWGGNNQKALHTLASASSEQNYTFARLIKQLLSPTSATDALRALTKQPGLSLVMASKIYRFCCPDVGAAVDRHSSYFFNSLPLQAEGGLVSACTRFRRAWANGQHRTSRLATVAQLLNSRSGFLCAATKAKKRWRPADVEMASYSWWSREVDQYR